MDVNALALLVGGTVLLSVIFLSGLCLGCMRHTSPPNIISELQNEDYIQSHNFLVSRPETRAYSTQQPLSPRLDPPSQSPVMRPGCSTQSIDDPSSDTEVYMNEVDDDVAPSEYITVLPDGCPSQSKQSLCNSQGLESESDYINLNKQDPAETQDKSESICDSDSDGEENYLNVSPSDCGKRPHTPNFSQAGSQTSVESDTETGAYVNVQIVPGQPIFGSKTHD